MLSDSWVYSDLIPQNDVQAIIDLVLEKANAKNLADLKTFLEDKSYQRLQAFSATIMASAVYERVKLLTLEKISGSHDLTLESFPVNGLRIAYGKVETLSPWHQDAGTWAHHKHLSEQTPFTVWIPLIASRFNTLQLCLDQIPIKNHHRNDKGQAFAVFGNHETKNSVVIDPVIGNGYIFTCLQPHRSYNTAEKDELRISVDFRFTIVN